MAPSLEVLSPTDIFTQATAPLHEEYYSHGLRERFRIDGLKLPVAETGPETGPETYADIEYDVDEAKFQARSEARIRAGGLESSVPEGWPKAVQGPLVWTSTDFIDEREYVYRLTDDNKAEILGALKYFKGGCASCRLDAFALLAARINLSRART